MSMISGAFDADRGSARILFVGYPESSHTHSWIELLEGAGFDVRLFALPPALPPSEWETRTYLAPVIPVGRLNRGIRRKVYLWSNPFTPIIWLWETFNHFSGLDFLFAHKTLVESSTQFQSEMVEKSIAQVVDTWKPDIVHTLGFQPASYLYDGARKYMRIRKMPLWVAQVRGGPDFALYRGLPDIAPKIENVLRECDRFIADNDENYGLAQTMGLDPDKISSLGVVPGTGGIDVSGLSKTWKGLPSQRERVIVWPKAYEAPSSKALPVFEALKLAWDRIKPCRIQMLWVVQSEIHMWLRTLPDEIQKSCEVYERMPRDFVFSLLPKARVMLAPSLTDGVPNTMMEAMATGAFPIVSPLSTITPVVEDRKNVLFARNLYPQELAGAIEVAMTDDELVDSAASANLELVKRIADRERIRERVNGFYRNLV